MKTDSEFLHPPYDYTLEDIADLPEPNVEESTYWMTNKRKMAVNLYKRRNNIKDTYLVMWLFFTCSKVAYEMIKEMKIYMENKGESIGNNDSPPLFV